MERNRTDFDEEPKSRVRLLAELEAMQRQVAEMKRLEDRCREAEEGLRAMEARSRLLRECAPMGVCAIDGLARITVINRKMQEMLQVTSIQESAPINFFEVPELLDSFVADRIRRCLEKKEAIVFEHPSPRSKGGYGIQRYHLSPVSDATGATLGAIAFGEDVTDLRRAEQALQESETRYRLLFQSAPIPMLERDASELMAHIDRLRASGVTDFEDYVARNPMEVGSCISMIKTVSYNAALLELMEVSHEAALSNGLGLALFENAAEMAREIFLMMAEGRVTNEKERVFTSLKGNRKHVLAKALVVSGHEDTFSRVIIALIDITQRKQAEEALRVSEQRSRDQAMRDDLTGLYNRRYLYRSLDSLIASCRAEGSQISVLFMDIDHFKDVVDAHGHLNGSQAIRELAETIRGSLETPAYAVAYAGDEFVIVLPGFDEARATLKALEIQDGMKEAVYLRERGIEVRLQASFGIATFPNHAGDMSGLLAAADQALFTVKQDGKNGVALYGSSILKI